MNELTKEKLEEYTGMFKEAFNEDADRKKLIKLIGVWGIPKFEDVLTFLYINGYREPDEGVRKNPYGLIYKLCKVWKLTK